MLIRYPHTAMVNKENDYREYKGHTKWLSLISSHFFIKFMHMLIISVLYVQSIKRASVKALVQVDFLMYALDFLMYELSKHKHNPYLIRKLSFCQKLTFWHQNSSHKCSVCLYCVSIVPDYFSKSCDTSWFSRICTVCTIYSITKCIKNYKGQ